MPVSYVQKSKEAVDELVRALDVKVLEEQLKKTENKHTYVEKLAELREVLREYTEEEMF